MAHAQLDLGGDSNVQEKTSLPTWLESNGFERFKDELEELEINTWDDALHLSIQDINDFINEVNANADAKNKIPLKLRVKFKQQFWHQIQIYSKSKASKKTTDGNTDNDNSPGAQTSAAGVIVLTDEQRQVVVRFNQIKARIRETFLSDFNKDSSETEGGSITTTNKNSNIFKSIDFNKLNGENMERAMEISIEMKEFAQKSYTVCESIERELMSQSSQGLNLTFSNIYDECIGKMENAIDHWNAFEAIYNQFETILQEIIDNKEKQLKLLFDSLNDCNFSQKEMNQVSDNLARILRIDNINHRSDTTITTVGDLGGS